MTEQKRARISANLKLETIERLKTIAFERGVTMTEVIDRAMELETYLRKVRQEGGKLLIEEASGTLRQIIRD